VTTLLWCLLIATFMPLAWHCAGTVFRYRQFGAIDNDHPRLQQAQLTGIGARALAAQQNSWEALAMFTPAVLTAQFNGVTAGHAVTASILFIAARLAYGCFYLVGLSSLRTLSWIIGTGAVIWLFVLAV